MLIGSGLQALASSGKFTPVALGQIRTAGNKDPNDRRLKKGRKKEGKEERKETSKASMEEKGKQTSKQAVVVNGVLFFMLPVYHTAQPASSFPQQQPAA
jgi:hypothetical protein